jgi:hypothetical protein
VFTGDNSRRLASFLAGTPIGTFDPVLSDAERAAITNALAQDLPGISEIIAIFPDYPGHVAEVLRLGLTQPEGNCGFEFALPIFLNTMRHG